MIVSVILASFVNIRGAMPTAKTLPYRTKIFEVGDIKLRSLYALIYSDASAIAA
ncbi:MAG: hypothetical protein V7L02_09510 [Nostoc sp.]|uniref:hypothetical protein n=1 Tax=Nostoc sp. TaxID=1180 RepID=UPI002FF4BC6F